jgi:type VI secretion system secreted protein VgrG
MGGGASQWLVDDSQGQLRMRLATKAVQAKPNVAPWLGEGLLLSTTARPRHGRQCAKHPNGRLLKRWAQLKAAQQLGQALSASAQQQGAQALHAFDAQQAVSSHVEAMCPTAQGKYTGLVNGQDAKKANGRTLTDPVERFAKPLVHLDTPVTAAFVTPSNISVFSGQDTGLAVQGDVQITAGHTLSSCQRSNHQPVHPRWVASKPSRPMVD